MKSESALEERTQISYLLSIYGQFLSERQGMFLQLHYDDDLSFAEIAEQYGVSRQAVHDAVRKGREALRQMEAKLGVSRMLRERKNTGHSTLHPEVWALLAAIDHGLEESPVYDTSLLKQQVRSLRQLLQGESSGVQGGEVNDDV